MLLDNLQSWNRKCSPSNVHTENKVPQLRIQVRQISFKFYFYAVIYHHHHIIIIIIIVIIIMSSSFLLCQFFVSLPSLTSL